jgi:bacillithiol system protein YtxJ
MGWIVLETPSQLHQIRSESHQRPQLIFKHSTRCNISSTAKARLERAGFPVGIDFYFLDLIAHRSISNQIAEDFHVFHESPQVILIKDGECIYDESHLGISMDAITAALPVS